MRARIAEWRALAPSMILGDFYPLTPYTDNHQRMAWQFDRPRQEKALCKCSGEG